VAEEQPELSERVRTLQQRFQETESKVTQQQDTVAAEEQRRRGRDRSQIARLIVYLFAASFLVVLIIIPLMALSAQAVTFWDKVTEKLLTLVSSVLLPVVTLVIGFYFGTEQGARSEADRP